MNLASPIKNWVLPKLKKMPFVTGAWAPSVEDITEEAIAGHQFAQSLAYECATTIAAEIRPGWSEKRTSDLMDTFLKDHGVEVFFHKSFAWYGKRARFQNFNSYQAFLPKEDVCFNPEEPVILDTAPIVNGFVADVGYSFCRVSHPGLEHAKKVLLKLRKLIPEWFEMDLAPNEIYAKVDEVLEREKFDNCHKQYPFSVLGHRVHKTSYPFFPKTSFPFSLHAYFSILSKGLWPELFGPHNKEGSKEGLWAIEPHLGGDGFGAKFEEILVVKKGKAQWLSDDVPHKKWEKKPKQKKKVG